MTTASKDIHDERAEALLHCECGRDDAMYPMPGHRADCPASVRGIVAAEFRQDGERIKTLEASITAFLAWADSKWAGKDFRDPLNETIIPAMRAASRRRNCDRQ